MAIMPVLFRSLMALFTEVVAHPAASITTLLYYSNLLPRNLNLERMVRPQLLHPENFMFHLLINVLRCFW
ncbi:hypothetical protein Patl1_34167 [Pistacia atlantica]|uniref:Uncharacterized protein n=1 Tax=Pistacia atlantica TaxID=434234 RepID=A0ACC0ZT79_9ROSI|nr:hypothetical protein Patl1_34167 [Pistacia atlantica]